jgi:hypothetical protein
MRLQLLVGLCLVLFLAAATTPARGDNSDYIFCTLRDNKNRVTYYSDVFQGDWKQSKKYENAFNGHVNARYSDVVGTGAVCMWEKSAGEARAKEDDLRASDRRLPTQRLVETNWTY